MQRVSYTLLFFFVFTAIAFSQKTTVSGIVKDQELNEPLFGVNVIVGTSGKSTDFDGAYSLELAPGSYEIKFTYIGYDPIVKTVEVGQTPIVLDIMMGGSAKSFKEVEVTADLATDRITPVAYSDITTQQLEEELGSQDMPMVLNSTPGAYATQTGGGDGDARVTIRGFNQRNVGVLVDGVPVNDMENGWVYWSNWFGLETVTKKMQVQRGLGASKLSLPSVGGTINIMTKGIESKRSTHIKQEIGNDGYYRTTAGFNSGRIKGGWNFSLAGSYKQRDGWVDGNYSRGFFYYGRIDKELGNHILTLSGYGAPQIHGQRSFQRDIESTDTTYASDLGVSSSSFNYNQIDKGRRYNEHWGMRDGKVFNTRLNYYHKPQFNFRHAWQVNEKLFWSNVAYLSIGNGGGTAPESKNSFPETPEGQKDIEAAILANTTPGIGGLTTNHIIRSSVNNHFWYGLLSTMSYEISENLTFNGGLDLRSYKGDHYREVRDLLGGEGWAQAEGVGFIQDNTVPLGEGEKFQYDNTGFVRWGGAYSWLEYSNDKWSVFANLTGATVGYKYEDYMKPKEVSLPDTTFYVSYNNPFTHNGQEYTIDSPEAKMQSTSWLNQFSYTFKTGASYRFNDKHSAMINAGYLSRPQRFSNVIFTNWFGDRVRVFDNYENERIMAFELGYSYRSPILSGNINTYYTAWQNKPFDRAPSRLEDPSDPDSDRIPYNVLGIDALHYGLEIDFAFKPIKQLTFEGIVSIGDWTWNSEATAIADNDTLYFDPSGLHVGDAAQLQLGGLIRVEPVKNFYIKLRGTYFARNFTDFNPENLEVVDGEPFDKREAWRLPNYMLFDFHAGYKFKINQTNLGVRLSITNLLNTVYLSDGSNNSRFAIPEVADYDAASATVYYGQGIQFNTTLFAKF